MQYTKTPKSFNLENLTYFSVVRGTKFHNLINGAEVNRAASYYTLH